MAYILINFGLVVIIGLYVMATYNGFVRLTNNAEEAWSDIQVQMKRRYNLIPNLVEMVKGYASHERETLEEVVEARDTAMDNDGRPASQAESENMLMGALRSLFAVAEAYPDLKANDNFRHLQDELSEIEDYIQKSRRYYNGNVKALNTQVDSFPSNLVARGFGFNKFDYFELSEEHAARQPVAVDF